MTTSITLRILLLNIVDSLSNYYDTLFRKLQAPAIKSAKYKIKTNEKGMKELTKMSENVQNESARVLHTLRNSPYTRALFRLAHFWAARFSALFVELGALMMVASITVSPDVRWPL